jgi:hypothetical protein
VQLNLRHASPLLFESSQLIYVSKLRHEATRKIDLWFTFPNSQQFGPPPLSCTALLPSTKVVIMAEASSETSTTEVCCSCSDLVLDYVSDTLGHREIPFANLKQTAQAGCSTCGMLLRGILTREQEIQEIEKVVLWSFGKTEPLNVNLWTEGVLKQELEFYWAREQSETEVLVQLRY